MDSWNSGHTEHISPRSLVWPTPPADPSPPNKRRWSTNRSSLESPPFTPNGSAFSTPRSSIESLDTPLTSPNSSINEFDVLQDADISSNGDILSPGSSDISSTSDVRSQRSSDISSDNNNSSSSTSFESPAVERVRSASLDNSRLPSNSSPERRPPRDCHRSHSVNESPTFEKLDPFSSRKNKKRSVSFNDEFGMPLTTIRVLADTEEHELISPIGSPTPDYYTLVANLFLKFSQPASDSESFINKVQRCRVSLENIRTQGTEFLGTIRVLNIAFEKRVFVRYTINGWLSYTDVGTTYVPKPDDSATNNFYDTFSFGISVAPTTGDVQFAICYRAAGQEFWDNNDGKNYRLQCVVVESQPPLMEIEEETQSPAMETEENTQPPLTETEDDTQPPLTETEENTQPPLTETEDDTQSHPKDSPQIMDYL